MKTLKCPLCGTPLKQFEDLSYEMAGTVGCPECEWTTFKAYPEEAWKAAEEFISKFPPIMRVWPGDKVKLYEDRHPKKIIGKNADRGILYLETASGPPEPVHHDDVELWPWEIEKIEAYKYWELDQKGGDE